MFDPFKQAKIMNAYKGFKEYTPPPEKETTLEDLKRLAGIPKYYDLKGDRADNVTRINPEEKSKYMRDNNIKPGDPDWFRLHFAKTHLTGESPFRKE